MTLLTNPGAKLVDQLVVEELPAGKISRLLLELVTDSLGHPVRIPVLVARGKKEGPVFGLTAAVHGNEINGIPVIHRLMDRVDLQKLRGTILAVAVVNRPGFEQHQRAFSDGQDLNHIMPGKEAGNVSQVYAYRFVERVIRHCEFLVDLHTASFGRVNSLYVRADMGDKTAAQMAYLQRPQIILNDPPSDHTVRGAAAELGIPAITVEIRDSQRFQKDSIRNSLIGLRSIFSHVGMLPKRSAAVPSAPVLCSRSRWLYTDHGGLLEVLPDVTDVVKEGEVIARLSNIFGDVIRQFKAPHEGIVIGKSTNPVGPTGARILHLGTLDESEQV